MISTLSDEIELLDAQVHKNMAIIPIKTPKNYKFDILTLEKGFELGLAKVKECEHSTVNTLIVENKSVVPLLLVDGEEIVGGDQNRIVNATILIAPQSEMKIPVNCTEHGRWGYKHEFVHSKYIADSRTRGRKALAIHEGRDAQQAVWNSIDDLENDHQFSSKTQAMAESYDNVKADLNEFIESFEVADGQNGVLIIIDGEIKGFEIFFSSEIYKEYHEKILKSYLINMEVKEEAFTINADEARELIMSVIDSDFSEKPNIGLEKPFEFKNDEGISEIYTYKDEMIHFSYFTIDEDDDLKKASSHLRGGIVI